MGNICMQRSNMKPREPLVFTREEQLARMDTARYGGIDDVVHVMRSASIPQEYMDEYVRFCLHMGHDDTVALENHLENLLTLNRVKESAIRPLHRRRLLQFLKIFNKN